MSRNAVSTAKAVVDFCSVAPSASEVELSDELEACVRAASAEAISDYGDDAGVITPDMIRAAGRADSVYVGLAKVVEDGFPASRHLTDPMLRDFWEVRDRLSSDHGLILMDRRIVVPQALRKRVLCCLHSAHQGLVGMKARANQSVYWPDMDASMRNFRAACATCNFITPSQAREPITLAPSPEWPFQQIVMDLLYVEHHTYLACADRFTGLLMLFQVEGGGQCQASYRHL